MKKRILDWLDGTSGWRTLKEVLLDRKIPKGVNWAYTLGSLLAFCFGIQAVTGMLLAMHYSPSPDHAYQSIQFLSEHVPFGAVLRGIHHWAASAMVVLAALHLLRVFMMGAYKHPRQLTWISGVLLLLVVIGLGFTGYLLPWDQKAYWATVVGSKIADTAPILGPIMGKILKGGEELGAITLTRFYSIHMLVLPGLFLLLVGAHLFLVVWHGISAPPERLKDEDIKAADWKERLHKRYLELKAQGKSFFPYIVAKDVVAVMLLFVVLLWLAVHYGAGLEDMADPTSTDYNPRPEWYFLFLFQALKYFPGSLEALATMVLPGIAFGLLFLLPFLDGGPARHPLQRKPWVFLGLGGLGLVGFLTVQGLRSPGTNLHFEKNPKVVHGRRIFNELRCASCHSIDGHGGIVGPTLDNAASRRGKEWIEAHFRNPQKLTPGSPMPNFKLLDEEVDDLTEYIISLEGGPYSAAAPALYEENCLQCHALHGKKGDDSGPDLSGVGRQREQGWIAEYIKTPDKIYPEAEMPSFSKQLSPEQIEDLARYLSAQRGPKVPARPAKH